MGFAQSDREGVELVEKARLICWKIGSERLAREIGHDLISRAVVAGRGQNEVVPHGDAAQVLVSYGNGMAEGVKENGVGGLRTNAGKSQQAKTQGGSWDGGEIFE
jgi:hypothetical protein